MDWKEIIKQAAKEILNDVKGDAVKLLKEQVIPGIKAAKDEFAAELKTEAAGTNSIWVKIRNYGLIITMNLAGAIANKAIEKASAAETALKQ